MNSIACFVIGVMAITIHLILNHDIYRKNRFTVATERRYYVFCHAALNFFLAETIWGMIISYNNVILSRIVTSWFFVSIALVTVFWNEYTVHSFDVGKKVKTTLLSIARAYFMLVVIAVLLNVFYPIFFSFDENGDYQVFFLRYIIYGVHILIYFLACVFSFILAFKTTGKARRRYVVNVFAALTIIITTIVQIWFYVLPINTVGYLIAFMIIYSYVISVEKMELVENLTEEKEAHRIDLEKALQKAMYENVLVKRQFRMIDVLSKGFEDAFTVSLSNNEAKTLKTHGHMVDEDKAVTRPYSDTWADYIDKYVHPEDKSRVRALTSGVMVRAKLKENDLFVVSYRVVFNGTSHYYRVNFNKVNENLYNDDLILMSYECIDELVNSEKQREEELKSLSDSAYRDELTGMLNRRSFEEAHEELMARDELGNIAVVTLDVNCLKNTNDDLGHDAGDELLKGAAQVIGDSFGKYGSVYRTGGDEFVAILTHDIPDRDYLREKFYDNMENWHGEKVKSVAISHGIAFAKDFPGEDLEFLIAKSDKLMYADKADFYASRGIDRRMQQTAYSVLCESYIKVLNVNLQQDSFQVIALDRSEKEEPIRVANVYSRWISDFIAENRVGEEYIEVFFEKTNVNYLAKHFRSSNDPIVFGYTRLSNGAFENVMMEIKKTKNYSETDESVYLFVKKII